MFKSFIVVFLLSIMPLVNANAAAFVNQSNVDNKINVFFMGLFAIIVLAIYAATKFYSKHVEDSDSTDAKSSGGVKVVIVFLGVLFLGIIVVFKFALNF